MQIIGSCFDEAKLFRAAYAYEQTRAYERPELVKASKETVSNETASEETVSVKAEKAASEMKTNKLSDEAVRTMEGGDR